MKKWRGNKWSKVWFALLLIGLAYDVFCILYFALTSDWGRTATNITAAFLMLGAVWIDWKTNHDD